MRLQEDDLHGLYADFSYYPACLSPPELAKTETGFKVLVIIREQQLDAKPFLNIDVSGESS